MSTGGGGARGRGDANFVRGGVAEANGRIEGGGSSDELCFCAFGGGGGGRLLGFGHQLSPQLTVGRRPPGEGGGSGRAMGGGLGGASARRVGGVWHKASVFGCLRVGGGGGLGHVQTVGQRPLGGPGGGGRRPTPRGVAPRGLLSGGHVHRGDRRAVHSQAHGATSGCALVLAGGLGAPAGPGALHMPPSPFGVSQRERAGGGAGGARDAPATSQTGPGASPTMYSALCRGMSFTRGRRWAPRGDMDPAIPGTRLRGNGATEMLGWRICVSKHCVHLLLRSFTFAFLHLFCC